MSHTRAVTCCKETISRICQLNEKVEKIGRQRTGVISDSRGDWKCGSGS